VQAKGQHAIEGSTQESPANPTLESDRQLQDEQGGKRLQVAHRLTMEQERRAQGGAVRRGVRPCSSSLRLFPSRYAFLLLSLICVSSLWPSVVVAEYTWDGEDWVWNENDVVREGDRDDARDMPRKNKPGSIGQQGKDTLPGDEGSGGGIDDYDHSENDREGSGSYGTNQEGKWTNENEMVEQGESDRSEDITVDGGTGFPATFRPPDNEPKIRDPPRQTHPSASFFAKPGTLAAVVGGAVVGLLCAILCVMLVVYRMRKKDEGSYALDEPKRSPAVNSYSKPPSREFYA
jgi:hypothetical protein